MLSGAVGQDAQDDAVDEMGQSECQAGKALSAEPALEGKWSAPTAKAVPRRLSLQRKQPRSRIGTPPNVEVGNSVRRIGCHRSRNQRDAVPGPREV